MVNFTDIENIIKCREGEVEQADLQGSWGFNDGELGCRNDGYLLLREIDCGCQDLLIG